VKKTSLTRKTKTFDEQMRTKMRRDAADSRGLPTIILFERSTARLRAGYMDALRRHVLYLDAFEQKANFVLRGHANLRTNEPGAVSLSKRRATAVANWLRELGVPASRIKILAQGSDQPWDVQMGGQTPLKWNRRVELGIHLITGAARAGSGKTAKKPRQ
jgi:outer membrane protein OmpA-like peptidoglycan-associated protein